MPRVGGGVMLLSVLIIGFIILGLFLASLTSQPKT